MSRRKDRERFLQRKQENPGYLGFRGAALAAAPAPAAELLSVVCTVCRRKRNVPVESVIGAGENFVCIRCQDDSGQDDPAPSEQTPSAGQSAPARDSPAVGPP